MKEAYDHKEVEPKVGLLWKKSDYAQSRAASRKSFSMYLVPPNASGPMHVGNALMIAIQDILARHHRAKGESTVWIPRTDHGGYETQVTFENELESKGKSKDEFTREELYKAIKSFVEHNNETIVHQVEAMGASVDWSRFRFTLDETSLAAADRMFRKMVEDNLIYRSRYMVNYCTACATVLADIELKEVESLTPLYLVKFALEDGSGYLSLATTKPEFLFTVTHILAHPQDARLSQYIGSRLINPSTGEKVEVIASKRKFDPKQPEPFLFAFTPSNKKYDFEYAIRNKLPTIDLLDWDGTMLERYPGLTPLIARSKEVAQLTKKGAIESVDDAYIDSTFMCKKGHAIQNIIRMTWFLKLDDERTPLRARALEAIKKEGMIVYPRWREKGLVEWIGKMHDWPLARQNAWGIRIPIWYELTDASLFTVWFLDAAGVKHHGNLKIFLDDGISLDEISNGLERIYATQSAVWTLKKEQGKMYLPETDTFDTWFSGALSAIDIDESQSHISGPHPWDVVVMGNELLRLSVAGRAILSMYFRNALPFRRVYLHSLLKSKDGKKMSKSLGNAITLDQYLKTWGADVTRMSLVSYLDKFEDFYLSDTKLEFFKSFITLLWTMGRVSDTANTFGVGQYNTQHLTPNDRSLLADINTLEKYVASDIEKYFLARAQERLVSFLVRFEEFKDAIQLRDDPEHAVALFYSAFKKYITLLHPFAPFITEQIYKEVYKHKHLLAEVQRSTMSR